MWKFHDFTITQILREINFEDSRSAKSAILTHLEALNLDFYDILHFFKDTIKGCTNLEFGKQTMSSVNYQAKHLLSSFVFASSIFCSAYRIVTTQSLFTHF